ncbi:gliding motility lipoprotein GldH [Robiginitalea sp. SC105]|uniref:gliding motility lipoprotein GldH n=1 Tax=Robiginitalea sp. SC105 TaxID=2762332 RepID=UPI00163B0614|nr:gliding motility lipoprotein GldH [Robiginitalea sp. SC105]MBC2838284.1 gliding motility lipoprotein GldH [Robiginitalea sp. SC105]
MRRLPIALLIILTGISCTDQLAYSEFRSTENGEWDRDRPMEFTVTDPDTTRAHNLYLFVRNDNTFPYSNLFLIAEMTFPDGSTQRDTLEYEMANAAGQWLGEGLGSVRENKLGYKRDVVFPSSGVYTFTVSHAMRKNGNVDGVQSLPGILDVGLQIESNE